MGAKIRSGEIGETRWCHIAKEANYCVYSAAKLCNLSTRQFYRIFSAEMNQPPKKWFKNERLRNALFHLRSNQSVKAAAIDSGYTQQANFCRDFKQHYGVRPSEVINQLNAV